MSQLESFTASSRREEHGVCVVLAGELDLGSVETLEHELRRADARGESVVLDVTALSFCDLVGLRALTAALAAGARIEGEAQGCVRKLFALTGQEHLFWTGTCRQTAGNVARVHTVADAVVSAA